VLAFVSLDEGFGIPALEAMARGVAVVASRGTALEEVCGDAALLVDPATRRNRPGAGKADARDGATAGAVRERGRVRARLFTVGKGGGADVAGRTGVAVRRRLPALVVDGDLEGAQEFLVLRGPFEAGGSPPMRRGLLLVLGFEAGFERPNRCPHRRPRLLRVC
jgi:hypothetical protein